MSLAAAPDYNMLPGYGGTREGTAGPKSTFSENIGVLYDFYDKVDSTFGLTNMWREEMEKRDEEVYKLTGKRLGVYYTTPEFGEQYRRGLDEYQAVQGGALDNATAAIREQYRKAVEVERQIDELRKIHPQIKSREQLFEAVEGQRQGIRESKQDITERAGVAGVTGQLIGGVAGSFTTNSPLNVASLFIPGGVGKTAWGRIGTEALVQSTIEGVNQITAVKKNAERMGETYDVSQGLTGVAFAGAGGAIFRGVFEGGAAIYKRLATRAQADDATGRAAKELLDAATPEEAAAKLRSMPFEQVQEINDIVAPVKSTGQRGAALEAEVEDFTEAANPFADAGAKIHRGLLEDTAAAIEEGRALPLGAGGPIDAAGFEVSTFNVKDLEVDAKAMQFKSGGDAEGVTDRLQGVKEWNPFLAGVVTVFERADGTRVVADGHQRVGLAKRMVAAGGKDIHIPAFVIKESEGNTVGYARAVAALKNIGEGSGTSMDAARVFREMPASARAIQDSLPPNSALVRDGRALAGMDTEAFMMIANGVVDEKIGAVVARMEQDPNSQRGLIALLAKEEPDTIYQAEQIVRQAQMVGFDTKEQATLFGSETITESLFKDKAKVLERALRSMREDKAIFRKLTQKQERIAQVGNVLDKARNMGELASTESILRTVEALAYRKGAVSELLTQFAKEAKDNGRYKPAAERFVNALRARLEEGGLSSLFSDATGDVSDVLAEAGRRAATDKAAASVDATAQLDLTAPKDTETAFADLVEKAKVQTKTPSRASKSAEASSPRAKSSKVKSDLSQRPPRQTTTRKESLPLAETFSSANMEPSSIRGFEMLGMKKSSKDKPILHVANDFKKLHKEAQNHLEPLRTWLIELSGDMPGVKLAGVRVKDLAEATDKAGKHKRPPNQISDYLGSRYVADTTDDIAELVARFRENTTVLDYEDFLASGRNGKGTGYRAVHLQALTRSGFSYEVQILPREIADVYEQARVPYAKYKKYRDDYPADIKKAVEADMKAGNDLFDTAWAKFQERDELARSIRELDLEEEWPVGVSFDAEGNEVLQTKRLRDVLADIEGSEKLTKAMTECLL